MCFMGGNIYYCDWKICSFLLVRIFEREIVTLNHVISYDYYPDDGQ